MWFIAGQSRKGRLPFDPDKSVRPVTAPSHSALHGGYRKQFDDAIRGQDVGDPLVVAEKSLAQNGVAIIRHFCFLARRIPDPLGCLCGTA